MALGDRDRAKKSERRHHRRYAVMFSVTVECRDSQEDLAGTLLDVSDGGVRLFLPRSLPVGMILEVRLETPVLAFTLPGRIAWTGGQRGRSYLHGVEFDLKHGPPIAQRLFDIARESW